jgi:hypothetical protein
VKISRNFAAIPVKLNFWSDSAIQVLDDLPPRSYKRETEFWRGPLRRLFILAAHPRCCNT